MSTTTTLTPQRLLSLYVMRGIIMILLAGESAGIYEALHHATTGTFGEGLVQQFFHHPWHGLHFWDLVQPSFMFMAGAALFISYTQKARKGITWEQNFKHVAIRSLKLFLLGTGLHCVYAGHLVWELWNVLTQLSVTTLIAYLVIRRSSTFQVVVGLVLVLISDILYRTILVPGFDQPFMEYHNFGAYMDTVLGEKINDDGWVAINCIPTAAHTIWGMVAGKLLISEKTASQKIKLLLIAGGIALVAGFGLDWSGITPIIKRISTGSFVLASTGWVLLMLAFLYWWIDVKQHSRYTWVAVCVGMNAIFIYLFFETVGHQWFNNTVCIFVGGFAGMLHAPLVLTELLCAAAVLVLEWYFCYWLYQRKIIIKL